MILFIYGENSYLASKRLGILKKEFSKKYGDVNMISIDEDNLNSSFDVFSHIEAIPFLSEKRMVIFKGILSSKKNPDILENIIDVLDHVPDFTVLVFYEGNDTFDKRKSLYKKLQKNAKIEVFNATTPGQWRDFISKTLEESNCTIEDEALQLLVSSWKGRDMWSLKNELEKLHMYLIAENRKEITLKDVKELVALSAQTKIFDLIDLIGKKKQSEALKEVEGLLNKGENEFYILTMIVYQFRNLIMIKSLTYKEYTKEKITQELKLHPFVISKGLYQVKNYSLDELKEIYKKLLELEAQMKTGEKEPKLALSTFIAKVSM